MIEIDTFEHLKYTIHTNDAGSKFYFNAQYQLHREEGPAVTLSNGNQYWYINGKLITERKFNLWKEQNGK